MKFNRLLIFLIVSMSLAACVSPPIKPVDISIPAQEREQAIKNITDWNIKGKIAFITSESRDSANIYWQKQRQDQQLKITTTLGINVFSLESVANFHTLSLDGKKYHGTDLDHLLSQVTGFDLPVGALENWLKGVRHSALEQIQYHPQTQLPESLTTLYQGYQWTIKYDQYGLINDVALAHQFTITRDGLTIRLKIHQWHLS